MWKLIICFAVAVTARKLDLLSQLDEGSVTQLENEIDILAKDLERLKDVASEDMKRSPIDDDEDIMSRITNVNMEEHVEGVSEMDIKEVEGSNDNDKRNAVIYRSWLWYMKDIAYVLDNSLGEGAKKAIRAAHTDISASSCIKFHVKTSADKYYLRYFRGSGCWSYVGFVKSLAVNGQQVSIGVGCGTKGIAIHETLHALGFYHEQSRWDRDQYVEILWENIQAGRENNFRKQSAQTSDNVQTNYDFDGVMHYGKTYFSKNGKPTILSIKNPSKTLGQRAGMTQDDKDQLYRLYDCTNTQKGWSGWSGWHPCTGTCQKSRSRFCYSDDSNDCTGSARETAACSDEECKTDGHWGKWTAWNCNAAICSTGIETRTRKCDNPRPNKDGKDCVGDGSETKPCAKGCPADCTFEDEDKCSYEAVGNWVINQGRTPSLSTGPSTGAKGSKFYIYMESSSPTRASSTHILKSIAFQSTSGSCLRFNYHMYGNTMGSLEVALIKNSGRASLFSIIGDQGNVWKTGKFDIPPSNNFRIEFKVVSGSSYRSDIALDNIQIQVNKNCDGTTQTAPPVITTTSLVDTTIFPVDTTASPVDTTSHVTPTPVDTTTPDISITGPPIEKINFVCNFENGVCNLKQSKNDELDWEIRSGGTPSSGTGPSSSRTSRTGKYVYLEASGEKAGDNAILETPFLKFSGDAQCLEFYYHMYGSQMGSLTISIKGRGGNGDDLLTITGDQRNHWHQQLIELKGDLGKEKKLIFNAVRGTGFRSDIAIDDIYIHPTSCPPASSKSPTALECSFDVDICEWVGSGDFGWMIHRGGTPTYGTGPDFSVSRDYRDYYIYTESSSRVEGEKAIITSPKIYTSSPMCMSLYASMNGINIGSLLVNSDTEAGSKQLLYYAKGQKGVDWFEVSLQLPEQVSTRIIIEAEIGNGRRGDIAIDDISVRPGKCPKNSMSSYCDFDKHCDFTFKNSKDSLCNFQKETLDDAAGKNTYMAWDNTRCGTKYPTAYLTVTNIAARGSCMTFHYLIKNSKHYCQLYVGRVYNTTSNGKQITQFQTFATIIDSAENAWIPYNVTLPPKAFGYAETIGFRSNTMSTNCGFIGIDDITISDGIC